MKILRSLFLPCLAWLLSCASGQAAAQEAGQSKVVDGVEIHYGILPAAAVARAHPGSHAEGGMHGGPPAGKDGYHLEIALFEQP